MKRVISILSSVFIGGVLLWANQPMNWLGQDNSNLSHAHHSFTLLDNPSVINNPHLKESLEDIYKESGFKFTKGDVSRNQLHFCKNCQNATLATKAPEATCKVDCEVVYDKTIYNPSFITFYNDELEQNFYFDYDEQTWSPLPYLTAELPEGEYTAYTQFWFTYSKDGSKSKEGAFALVFKENVKIPCEEKLIFDAEEAVNQLKFNTILPDGQMPVLDVVDNKTGEVLKGGNVELLTTNTFLIDKEIGPIISFFAVTNRSTVETDEMRQFDFYVNDLSDRFCAYRHCNINTGEDVVMACQYLGDLIGDKAITTNIPEDYFKISTNIAHTPAYYEFGLEEPGFGINTNFTWQTKNEGSMFGRCNSDSDYIYYYQDSHCNQEALLPLVSVQPFDATFIAESEDKNGDIIEVSVNYGIAALPFAYVDDQIQYVNNNHSECGNYAFQKPEFGYICDYPGQPRYTFWKDQQTGLIGNNAPINSVMNEPTPIAPDSQNFMNFINPTYIGRWGEVRNVDNVLMSTRIDYNGEVIYDNSDAEMNLENWGAEWGFENHPAGTFDYYFDNTNIAVDGIPGRNYTHVFCDWTKEDKNAPVIQMLMFRNSLDEITDCFDNAAEGIVEFSGGDFNYHQEYEPKYKWYFSCEPMEVKLEYSPYNKEAWSEIEVTEVPEYYYMPGFGYFYRGSLACVDKMSENGWYDLKFTFTDEVGNYMEQTVSPAFKVASLTDKAEISTSGVQVYANNGMIHVSADGVASVDVYTLDGRSVFRGTGNDIPMNNGVYIVKVNTTDGAESVHKVIL